MSLSPSSSSTTSPTRTGPLDDLDREAPRPPFAASFGYHPHDEDPLSVNPFAQENPFADLPSSSSHSSLTAAATADTTIKATASSSPIFPVVDDPHAVQPSSQPPQPPQPPQPHPHPQHVPSLPAPIHTNGTTTASSATPAAGSASSPVASRTSATFSPRVRSGVSSPSLRRSMSALAVQVDPLLNPAAATPSPLSLTTSTNTNTNNTQDSSSTTTVTSPLTAQASMAPTSSTALPPPPASATSTRTLPGTPAHPASSTPPNLYLANGTIANPLTPGGSLPRPVSASVPPTPTTPSGTRKRAPLSFSQAQLLVPSLSASPFSITVSDPTKVGDTISPFVVYKVVTKVQPGTRPEFKPDSFVSRRYSEFLWLAQRLAAAYPGVVVPGLPEKQALGRFQEDFVEHRRVGLQLFLRKVAAHPLLNQAEAFRLFVEMDQLDTSAADGGATSAASAASSTSKLPLMHQDIDPYFESRRRSLDQFESQLKAMSKSLDHLSGCVRDSATAHFAFGDTVQMLAEIEPPASMGAKLEKLGELHKRARDIVYAMAALDLGHLEGALEEQLRTVGAIRAALGARAAAHAHWQALDAAKQKKLGVLKKSKFEQPQVKAELDDLETQVRVAQCHFDTVSGTLRGELERLDVDKVHELTIALQAMTDAMFGHQQSMANLWEDFLEKMRL